MTKIAGVRVSDIAEAAGVSTATVDRVLNERKGVRRMTAERVWETVRRLQSGGTMPVRTGPMGADLRFDFILPAEAGPATDDFRDFVEGAGERMGVGTQCHAMQRMNPSALADAIRDAAAAGSDGIAFHAPEHPLVREAVEEVSEQGVPCVSVLTSITHARTIGHVGVDHRAAGRTAGYLLGRFLRGLEGKVAILAGSNLYRSHEEREIGFRTVLRESFPDLQMLDVVVGHDDPDQNHAQVAALLRRNPDLIGLYALGSGNRGVVQALEEAGRDQDVVFIAHNMNAQYRRYLLAGVMDAVIHQDLEREAEMAIELLLGEYGATAGAYKPLPIEVVLRENIVD